MKNLNRKKESKSIPEVSQQKLTNQKEIIGDKLVKVGDTYLPLSYISRLM